MLNDAPGTYGSEGKRIDCRDVESPYNSKRHAPAAWADLVRGIRAPYILASTSDETIMSPPQVIALLAERGHVAWVALPHRRYIGSRTGIYNPAGEKVGTPGETTTMARPTKYTDERVDGIVAAIAGGSTIKAAAEGHGISVQTLARWRKDDPALAERVAQAEAEFAMVRIITEAAPKDWRAAAWFLERRFHLQWRERKATEIANAGGEDLDALPG